MTDIDFATAPDNTNLTTREAADYLRVHYCTLIRWRKEGRGPACRRRSETSHTLIYRLGDLRAWEKTLEEVR